MKVGVKNLNLFKNLKKEKIMLCVQYVVCDFSIEHEGENDINKHKSTPKHKQLFDSTQNQKKK